MSFFGGIDTGVTDYEIGGGALEPIPDGTRVLAVCEQARNRVFNSDEYIELKWRISRPEEYSNRVVFHKLRVYDAEKGEKHKRMLAAIAVNAGGGLFASMSKRNEHEPSDESLMTILNRPMVLQLGVWDMDGKKGNWVQAVSKRKGAAPAPAPVTPTPTTPAANFDDDDIPF